MKSKKKSIFMIVLCSAVAALIAVFSVEAAGIQKKDLRELYSHWKNNGYPDNVGGVCLVNERVQWAQDLAAMTSEEWREGDYYLITLVDNSEAKQKEILNAITGDKENIRFAQCRYSYNQMKAVYQEIFDKYYKDNTIKNMDSISSPCINEVKIDKGYELKIPITFTDLAVKEQSYLIENYGDIFTFKTNAQSANAISVPKKNRKVWSVKVKKGNTKNIMIRTIFLKSGNKMGKSNKMKCVTSNKKVIKIKKIHRQKVVIKAKKKGTAVLTVTNPAGIKAKCKIKVSA